jgi:hypothetical protein
MMRKGIMNIKDIEDWKIKREGLGDEEVVECCWGGCDHIATEMTHEELIPLCGEHYVRYLKEGDGLVG